MTSLFPHRCKPWKQDSICCPRPGGCTPQLLTKSSHACLWHSHKCAHKTKGFCGGVTFQQKYREAQISWQKLLESSAFIGPHSAPPQGLPKRRGASPVLAVTMGPYPPLHLPGQKNCVQLFSVGKVCNYVLLIILIIKSNLCDELNTKYLKIWKACGRGEEIIRKACVLMLR